MIELPRRKFLTILTGVIAAPAVIKADKLMRVKTIVQPDYLLEAATESYTYGYYYDQNREVVFTHLFDSNGRRVATTVRPMVEMIDKNIDWNAWALTGRKN